MTRMRLLKGAAGMSVAIGLALRPVALAQEVKPARYQHLGVASCAASVCHGKIAPQPDRDVGLDEYRTWSQNDAHARAYRVLELPRSKRIAANLGLRNPSGEAMCLGCHADYVPAPQRGPKFQLSDGVGCEACHGGAEKWIQSHASASVTHAQNVAQGMYPSESPAARADLCLSCHLGTKDKFATHQIMGAGHPRLSFELDAYTANQPAHFKVDADYVRRKGKIDGINLWLTGQLENARAALRLLQSPLFHASGPSAGMFPELAFYDCHSCHHLMDQPRWTPQRAGAGIAPGTVRLQTQNLVVLQTVLARLEPPDASELGTLTGALVLAGQRDREAVVVAAQALLDWLNARQRLGQRSFSRAEVTGLRRALLECATTDKVGDYGVAEQIVMGVESLSYSIGDRAARKAALDRLFATVKNGASFNPTQFTAAARAVLPQL